MQASTSAARVGIILRRGGFTNLAQMLAGSRTQSTGGTMQTVHAFLPETLRRRPRAAIFVSGSGSNAEKILEYRRASGPPAFDAAAIVTDRPRQSRAEFLAKSYDLPLVTNDIRQFYKKHGEERVSIATPRGQELRAQWTDALREQLAPYGIDFGILAGFIPLTNLVADFPCLNVHPGDLTYVKEGRRYLVGLHTVPIERAILEGLDTLRSSVILADPYSGQGEDMDAGPLLGLSEPVEVELAGRKLSDLQQVVWQRPAKRPRGGYGDDLEEVAFINQERLKKNGDWVVFPRVVADFARNAFGVDDQRGLHFRINDRWHPIKTVVYNSDGKELVFRST